MQSTISACYCSCCGNKMYIPRAARRQKEKAHIKNIYCPLCRSDQPFIEIREFDYLTPDRKIILERGILAYYYAANGLDFLKLLIYLPDIDVDKEFVEIVELINSGTEIISIKEDAELLKKIIISIKKRNEKMYQRILHIVLSRTIFIKIV